MTLEAFLLLLGLVGSVVGAIIYATIRTRRRPVWRVKWHRDGGKWWAEKRSSFLFFSSWDSRYVYEQDKLSAAREAVARFQREEEESQARAKRTYYPATATKRPSDLRGALSEPKGGEQ